MAIKMDDARLVSGDSSTEPWLDYRKDMSDEEKLRLLQQLASLIDSEDLLTATDRRDLHQEYAQLFEQLSEVLERISGEKVPMPKSTAPKMSKVPSSAPRFQVQRGDSGVSHSQVQGYGQRHEEVECRSDPPIEVLRSDRREDRRSDEFVAGRRQRDFARDVHRDEHYAADARGGDHRGGDHRSGDVYSGGCVERPIYSQYRERPRDNRWSYHSRRDAVDGGAEVASERSFGRSDRSEEKRSYHHTADGFGKDQRHFERDMDARRIRREPEIRRDFKREPEFRRDLDYVRFDDREKVSASFRDATFFQAEDRRFDGGSERRERQFMAADRRGIVGGSEVVTPLRRGSADQRGFGDRMLPATDSRLHSSARGYSHSQSQSSLHRFEDRKEEEDERYKARVLPHSQSQECVVQSREQRVDGGRRELMRPEHDYGDSGASLVFADASKKQRVELQPRVAAEILPMRHGARGDEGFDGRRQQREAGESPLRRREPEPAEIIGSPLAADRREFGREKSEEHREEGSGRQQLAKEGMVVAHNYIKGKKGNGQVLDIPLPPVHSIRSRSGEGVVASDKDFAAVGDRQFEPGMAIPEYRPRLISAKRREDAGDGPQLQEPGHDYLGYGSNPHEVDTSTTALPMDTMSTMAAATSAVSAMTALTSVQPMSGSPLERLPQYSDEFMEVPWFDWRPQHYYHWAMFALRPLVNDSELTEMAPHLFNTLATDRRPMCLRDFLAVRYMDSDSLAQAFGIQLADSGLQAHVLEKLSGKIRMLRGMVTSMQKQEELERAPPSRRY